MCGRYTLFSDASTIEAHYNSPFKPDTSEYNPSWNIAPGSQNPVMLLGKAREPGITFMKWGLVPAFADDPQIGYKMINARSETIDEKPSFQKPFQRKRCPIPTNGFYEWKQLPGGKTKLPFFIHLLNEDLFSLAGIFEHWKSGDKELFTYSIITTEANAMLQPLHERMPVILDKSEYDFWLDPMNNDVEGLKKMMNPYPAEEMRVFRIDDAVNKPANNSPELIEPIL